PPGADCAAGPAAAVPGHAAGRRAPRLGTERDAARPEGPARDAALSAGRGKDTIARVEGESITAATQRFYDAVGRRNPELAFLNYGFADPSSSGGDMTPDEVADASRRLYDAVLTGFEGGGRLLEVGCGRGGGAAFVLESRHVDEYVGLDLSNEHARMCR